MPDLSLGASTWCFNGLLSQDVKSAIDGGIPYTPGYAGEAHNYFRELATTILNSGIKAVELWYSEALQDADVFAELERLSAAGKIWSVHSPFNPMLDLSSPDAQVREAGISACCRAAQLLSNLNGSVLVIHGSATQSNPVDLSSKLRNSTESIGIIADCCRDHELQVAVELLTRPNLGDRSHELLEMLEMINRPNAGFCIDVNHVFPEDMLLPTIHKLGRHILTLHISDYDGEMERHWLPMQGSIDWSGLVRSLKEIDYGGPFMYETRFDASGIQEAANRIEENYSKIMMSANE